jgi:uncharacterized protein YdhG (YjbR/CyaY superfamily)
MDSTKTHPTTIDEYIAPFPEDIQQLLNKIRAVIKDAAPEGVEKISYQMPGFYQKGMLVWFAAFKDHISLFPAPNGIDAFEEEIAPYKHAKGTIQFPLGQPIPYDLIRRIVLFRVGENMKKKKG